MLPDYLDLRSVVDAHGIDGQIQYLSRCLRAPNRPIYADEPFLSDGLRVINDGGTYHDWYVHEDDAAELAARYLEQIANGRRF